MWRSVLVAMFVVCLSLPVRAEEKALDAEAVTKLVAQLGSSEAAVREAAAEQLSKGGGEVIAPLVAAADSTDLEVISRCVGVLADLRNRENAELKAAATDALQKLVDGRNRSASRRAKLVLQPPVQAAQLTNRNRVHVHRANNQTDVTAEENGKKYEITEKASGEITVKTSEPDAKGVLQTKEFSGKNAADLKAKAPEAHALYEKYEKYTKAIKGGANLNVNFGAVPAAGPFQIQAQVGNLVDGRRAALELQKHRETVQKTIDKLKALTEKKDLKPEELKPILDELEAANQSLDEAAKKLNP